MLGDRHDPRGPAVEAPGPLASHSRKKSSAARTERRADDLRLARPDSKVLGRAAAVLAQHAQRQALVHNQPVLVLLRMVKEGVVVGHIGSFLWEHKKSNLNAHTLLEPPPPPHPPASGA